MDAKRVFGIQLKELRLSRGFTQEILSEKIDRSVDALSKLERGVSQPSLDTVLELSKQLQVPIAKLLEPFEKKSAKPAARVKLEAKFEALLNDLDDRQLTVAIDQIKILVRK